ncbi:MAG TPA: SRPBCC family protein [Mycobacteriales bacterium]|nr:SRPBCC family protein [Mycobacteriales bacterium]
MTDVEHQINSVAREVGNRILEAGEGRVVTIRQTYPATVDDVWDACTNADRIPRWFLPLTGDLRVGGHYQFEGNAGGVVEKCDPPKSFSATWEFGGQVSWIVVRLSAESPESTLFELEHVFLVDDKWNKFGPGAVGIGWDMGLMGLGLHLTSGESVDPDPGWLASESGRRMVALSGELWREAHLASGVPADVARGAADRTIAAYTP